MSKEFLIGTAGTIFIVVMCLAMLAAVGCVVVVFDLLPHYQNIFSMH